MGVLNVTPDSFSDGGDFIDAPRAVARLREIAAEGAAICDVGAESTRPGSAPVDAEEELSRLAPVFAALAPFGVPGAPTDTQASAAMAVSIDTSKARVADAALRAGAVLVNDVTAGRGDADLLPLVAERGAAVCLVHMLGDPRTMQESPRYDDVVDEVRAFLETRLDAAVRAGVREERILLDPGIGFGKRLEDNLALLRGLRTLAAIGRPVVVGVSRKSMFAALLGRAVDERMAGSLAAGLLAVDEGAAVVRVHDVRDTADALRVVDLEMTLVETSATRTDHLADTVDYEAIAQAVAGIMEGPPVSLLEHLAALVADRVMAEPRVLEVLVTVRKPEVVLARPVTETAVTLRRAR
jgi:dihydropteroate synthase